MCVRFSDVLTPVSRCTCVCCDVSSGTTRTADRRRSLSLSLSLAHTDRIFSQAVINITRFRRPVATNLYFDSNIRQQAVTPQYDVVGVRLTSRLSSCGIHIHCRPASRLNMLSTSCLCLECSAPAARAVGGAAIVPWSPAWHVVRLSVWHWWVGHVHC